MPQWQVLAQWEKCSASRYLLHPSGNMSPQLSPLWEQHSLKIYSIAALTHMYIILVWYCNHHYSTWHKKCYWTGTRWQLAVKICNEEPVRSISEQFSRCVSFQIEMTNNPQYQKVCIAFDLLISSDLQEKRMEAEEQKAGRSTAGGFRNSQKHRLTCWGTRQQFFLPYTKKSCLDCGRNGLAWILGQGPTASSALNQPICGC